MKTTLITMTALMIAWSASAQTVKETEVPKPVLTAFAEHFKGAKAEKWEKEKDGNYEAEFDWNKTETSATFSAAGQLVETETELKTSELPKTVSDYVSKNYTGYKLAEAAKITDAAGKVFYEAEVKKGKEEMDLIFDANGTFVRKHAESGEEKDKDKK
ncbi:MAG: PepSY-like domain-containing protein [Bacteroidia bacterium]